MNRNEKINVPNKVGKISPIHVDDSPLRENPKVDLKYLHHSSRCFKYVVDQHRKKKDRQKNLEFWDNFQKFLFEFSENDNISTAIRKYSSHINGQKIGKSNNFVKGILENLPSAVAEYAEYEMDHLHLKANGKGESIIYGFQLSSTFYIVGIDPYHKSL